MKKNKAASLLGKLSVKARKKKYKDFGAHMAEIRAKKHTKPSLSTS